MAEEDSILEETYKAYTELPFWQQLVAGIAPVSGEAISAYETPIYKDATVKSFEEGDVLGTAGNAAMTGLSALGAIPALGMGIRVVKGAGKVAGKALKPKPKRRTSQEIEDQGGPRLKKLNENQLGKIMSEHGFEWDYHENGGITVIEEYTTPSRQLKSKKKHFRDGASLGKVRDWLGY